MNLESFFFKDEDPTEEKEELPDANGAADTESSAPVASEPETAPVEAPSAVEPDETEYNIVIHTMTDGPAESSCVTLPPSSFSCNLSEDLVPLPSGAVINTGDAVLEPKELIITSNPPTPSKSPLPAVAEKKSPKVVSKPKVVAPKVNVPTGPIQTEPKPAPVVNGAAPGVPKQWNTLFSNKTPQVAKPAPVKVVKPVEVKAVPKQQNGWKTASKMNGKSPNLENGDCKMNGSSADDHQAAILADHIVNTRPIHKPQALIPRGILNQNSNCYVNSTLQCLIACPPLFYLLKNMPIYNKEDRPHSSTPVLDMFSRLFSEFRKLPYQDNNVRKEGEICLGKNLDPKFIYDKLIEIEPNNFKRGRQEDADEFLNFMLNGIHEEIVKITKEEEKVDEVDADEYSGDWEKVTKKKGIQTRKDEQPKSPITDIFQGMISTSQHQHGQKPRAIQDPFFSFKLPISDVSTLTQAINKYTAQEVLQDHAGPAKRVQNLIDVLPPIFIVQLKRFMYQNGKNVKINDEVKFKTELVIEKEHITKKARSMYDFKQRSYKLYAILHHHGNQCTKGHYSADVFHIGLKCWLRYDDEKVQEVKDVLKHDENRTPYILFYRRTDLG